MKRYTRYSGKIIAAVLVLATAVQQPVYAAEYSDARDVRYEQGSTELLTAGVGELFAAAPLTEAEYMQIAKEAEGALWGYTHLGICNVDENNLNIRKDPNEEGKLVGKLPKNAACEIVSSEDGWAYITSGKVEGYVKEDYLLTGYEAKKKGEELASAIAVSKTDGLNIREEPSTEAEVVTQVANGESLEIAEIYNNGWIKVFLDDEEVYISEDYVDVKSDLDTAITMTELLYGQGVSDVRVDLCQYLCMGRNQPYKRSGLLGLCTECFQEIRSIPAPFFQGPGQYGRFHFRIGIKARRSGLLCKGRKH